MGVIYRAFCTETKKSYIGQTVNFTRRKEEHLKAKDNYIFHQALRKYGQTKFIWTILEECDNSLLDEREKYWIQYYNSYSNGYNSTLGGDNANALLNWKKKNPDKVRENALNGLKYAQQYNKEHREEHLKHLSEAQKKGAAAVRKKVKCIELNLIFDSIADAERWSLTPNNPNGKKADHQHISKVCKGQRKTTGGYHWKYIDEGE